MKPVALTLIMAMTALTVSGCVGAVAVVGGRGLPASVVSPCSNGGMTSAGTHCGSLTFGEHERSYRIYVPAKVANPAPLLLVLHGALSNGANIAAVTFKGFDRRADETGVLIVYPDSVGRLWNDGRKEPDSGAGGQDIDDVGFLRALVVLLGQQYPIDPERIFVTGFSSGGMLTLRLACEASDVFRGFVGVAASLFENIARNCHPAFARRVALIDGTADAIVPWNSGMVGIFSRGRVIGAEASFATFRAIAGCSGVELGPSPQDKVIRGSNVIVHRAIGCSGEASIVLFEIKGGLHVWPGGSDDAGASAQRKMNENLDATAEVWRFLGLDAIRREPQDLHTERATE